MIPAPNVVFAALDDVDVVDDAVGIYMELTDGSIVAALVPLTELIERAHCVIEAADAAAYSEAPVLQ